MIGRLANGLLGIFNLKLESAAKQKDIDLEDKEFQHIYSFCREYTMTSVEDMYALYNAVRYVIRNNVEGDFVECGVWRGGSAMLIAMYLEMKKIKDRKLFLYDAFSGMTKPGKLDVDHLGNNAIDKFQKESTGNNTSNWSNVSCAEVKANINKTFFPIENVVFVEGEVENTIPGIEPKQISLLRLDTDWYKSTKHELIHLYPLLSNNGVLILDDHGHWLGARKAALEYFEQNDDPILLSKINYSTRIGVKNLPRS